MIVFYQPGKSYHANLEIWMTSRIASNYGFHSIPIGTARFESYEMKAMHTKCFQRFLNDRLKNVYEKGENY